MIAEDGYISIINGNYVEDKDGKRPEAIKLANQIHIVLVLGIMLLMEQLLGNQFIKMMIFFYLY